MTIIRGLEVTKLLFYVWVLVASLIGCGVRGDPEPPEAPPLLRSGQESETNRDFMQRPRSLPLSIPTSSKRVDALETPPAAGNDSQEQPKKIDQKSKRKDDKK